MSALFFLILMLSLVKTGREEQRRDCSNIPVTALLAGLIFVFILAHSEVTLKITLCLQEVKVMGFSFHYDRVY